MNTPCQCKSCVRWRQIITRKQRYSAKELDLRRSAFKTKAQYIEYLRGQMSRDCERKSTK